MTHSSVRSEYHDGVVCIPAYRWFLQPFRGLHDEVRDATPDLERESCAHQRRMRETRGWHCEWQLGRSACAHFKTLVALREPRAHQKAGAYRTLATNISLSECTLKVAGLTRIRSKGALPPASCTRK